MEFKNKLVAVLNKSRTYLDQIEKTKQVKDQDLIYYGIVLFGDWQKVTELTCKFSLWR